MGVAGHTKANNLLSADNLARIVSSEAICQEQILAPRLNGAQAGLIDQWGRIHPLAARTVVGRSPGDEGICILESSVSRHHAEVYFDESKSGWFVIDRDSKNGTLVNDDTINAPIRLSPGDAVFFGQVGFLFFLPSEKDLAETARQHPSETLRAEQGVRGTHVEAAAAAVASAAAATFADSSTDLDETTYVGLQHTSLTLLEPSGGGGGFLETANKRVQLTSTQFAFLQLLTEGMLGEPDKPESVRGFIRSSELLADLPWDTAHPEENHLKQLVRRVRRSLTRAGMGNLIESRRGFGYRIRVIPTPH